MPCAASTGSARRAEEELLLRCCVLGETRRAAEIPPLISGAIDWTYFRRIASWHCVMPRVYRVMREGFSRSVPKSVLDHMHKEYVANALRNRFLTAELVRLVQRLADSGIVAITLKGPTLALAACGDVGLRQFGDLDLLVPEKRFRAAVDALEVEGYRPRRFRKGKKSAQHFLDLEDEFVKPGSIALLDVHWSLLPKFLGSFFSYDELLRSSTTVSLLGTSVRTVAAAELLLFLCVHGAKHGWKLLGWVCDIAGLLYLDEGQVDLKHVFALASQLGYARALSLGLLLAADLLDASLPQEFLSMARSDPVVRNLAAGISARLFRGIEARPTLYQDWMVPFCSMEGFAARSRYLAWRAFTPAVQDREFIDLGRLYPLYLLVRPLRLLWEQGPRLLGRRVKPDVIPSAPRFY